MEEIFTFENLYNAYLYTRKGKRDKACVQKYSYNVLNNTLYLEQQLQSRRYQPGKYHEFYVFEPKKRLIKAPPFRDRVVQRCLCQHALEPAIERQLIFDTYACRKGKGTHKGLARTEEFMRRHYRKHGRDGWIIKGDITSYFYSIDHKILKAALYPRVEAYDVWWLIERTLESIDFNGVGLPLGNQSSQWFANFYLSGFDHYCKEVLKLKSYVRYMDDWVAIVETKTEAREALDSMKAHLRDELRLEVNNKTQIAPLGNGINFLGFRLYLTDTGKVIKKVRQSTKERTRRKLASFEKQYRHGLITREKIEKSYVSSRGHMEHGNCYTLIRSFDERFENIFKGDG